MKYWITKFDDEIGALALTASLHARYRFSI